ncbi:HAD-superfamily hydrolase, subfamily IA, variant 3 [Haladaptatus paucihalophilus DX253]|uniref:HAD-superfamily hydrolase, subfamily IA, variant 3 n=1 Tax=Haladaptatus paucihalophilus DX253 TaxID=797209 RepID=E7QTG7_HALPU|nr:HAD family hydrolase [Haladaptatus paucihalophilus]EFW91896.1 HAD-superfamily hydrolase, subfamily IA, variant 3 [Haladaptatus paucihalophilus DX253]SHK82415.1 putative hydrolase of the HAD superfamily [Haladaptatus paucihalophilus DX253]
MTALDAVLFDLDSTLCVSEQDEEAVLTDAFDRASVEQYCTVADIIEAVDDIPTAETSHEFYELCFAAAAREVGVEDHHASALATAYEECVDHSAVSFRPGAEDALAAASETNVGLVTNGDEATQTVKLDALGIADAFDTLVFVDPRNGVPPKPDAAPFEKALTDLGVAPDDALHVGDSLRADVAGANALGIDSVWVPHENRRIESAHEPTHTLTSLAEFPELL